MTAQTPQNPAETPAVPRTSPHVGGGRPRGVFRRRPALGAALAAGVLAVTGATWVITTQGASAASTCSGSLVEHSPVDGDYPIGSDTLIGYVDIYYNSSTGDNCARAVTTGAAYGKASSIIVEIDKCRETRPSRTCTVIAHDRDPKSGFGSFGTFAGPVRVNAPRNCIQVTAHFAVPVPGDHSLGAYPQSSANEGAKHCG